MMGIVFRCKSCGSRFEVDARLAGRTGRCKRCGAPMTVPRESEKSPEPAAAIRRDAPSAAPGPPPGHATNWIDAVTSQVALKPITVAAMRPIKKPSPLDDDDGDPSPYYELAGPPPTLPRSTSGSRPAGQATIAYRGMMGDVARFFRVINQFAYLISIPFLMALLLGVVLQNRPLALMGAGVVVLLNVGRLVSGLINVVAIPFRDGPIQGAMFLIPPLTFIYLHQHWKRMRKPVRRIVEPVFTIGLVLLAFAFLPVTSSGSKAEGETRGDRIRAGARDLKKEIEGQLPDVDAGAIKDQANQALRRVEQRFQPAPDSPK